MFDCLYRRISQLNFFFLNLKKILGYRIQLPPPQVPLEASKNEALVSIKVNILDDLGILSTSLFIQEEKLEAFVQLARFL